MALNKINEPKCEAIEDRKLNDIIHDKNIVFPSDRFKLAEDLLKLPEDTRSQILLLTSMLNREKNDNYVIPRKLCDTINGAIVDLTFREFADNVKPLTSKNKQDDIYCDSLEYATETVLENFKWNFDEIINLNSHDTSHINADFLGELRGKVIYSKGEKKTYDFGKVSKDVLVSNEGKIYDNVNEIFLGGIREHVDKLKMEKQMSDMSLAAMKQKKGRE